MSLLRPFALLCFANFAAMAAEPTFTPLFNGRDLTGWRGGNTFDPRKLTEMPEAERTAKVAAWTASMNEHWRVENGELVNDGHGDYATTEKDYGNFELRLEYKTVPLGDSGIYLRGCPQVQIWDHTNPKEFKNGADKGSGGLWNNRAGSPGKDPLVLADKPFGEWNQVRVVMVGSRVSVWLNGQQTVKHAILENYFDKDRLLPVPARGPIQLQTHGAEIRWRKIELREIAPEESVRILKKEADEAGFVSIFNGRDWTGWAGPTENYEIVDGAIRCLPKKGGTPHTVEEFGNFTARLEMKIPNGANNGLAIRYPGEGDTAYVGMCELQVLDDQYELHTGSKIDPRQAHGSAYGMVAAARGYQFPNGEWNYEEVAVKGSTIRVELNGTVILQADLAKVDPATYMAGHAHPGKDRTTGFFGLAGHNDPVEFRELRIRKD